eukprot:121887_1
MLWNGWSTIFIFGCFFVTLQHPSNAWNFRVNNEVTANGRGSTEPPSSNPYPRRLLKELTVEKCNRSLRDWINDNGGDASGCEVKDSYPGCKGKGWGLVACKGVKAGEVLARIPFKCCLEERETGRKGGKDINTHHIASFQNGVYAENLLLGMSGEVTSEIKLALRLITERIRHLDPQSQLPTSSREGGINWGPALDALPDTVPGCPIFFNQTMVAALQDQTMKEEVTRISSAILRTARGLSHLPGTPEDLFYGVRIDQDAMAWAWAIVASRAIRVNGNIMLTPLLDMVNHNFEANVKIVVASSSTTSSYGESGGVELRAIKSISNGEPLEMRYGPLTNDGLLVKYGFVDPVNPYDVCIFKFESTKLHAARNVVGIEGEAFGDSSVLTDTKDWIEIAPWQLTKLQELGLAGLGEAFHVNLLCSLGRTPLTPLIDPRLFAALRVLYASNESELQEKSASQLCNEHLYVSMRNEGLVSMTLIGLCVVILKSFPTSSMNDEMNLAGGGGIGSSTGTEQESITTGEGIAAAIDSESMKWIHFWQNQSTIIPLHDDGGHPMPSSTSASQLEGDDETFLVNRDMYNVVKFRIGKKNILNTVIKALSAKLLIIRDAIAHEQSQVKEAKRKEKNITRPKLEAPTLDSTTRLGGGGSNNDEQEGGGSALFWFE